MSIRIIAPIFLSALLSLQACGPKTDSHVDDAFSGWSTISFLPFTEEQRVADMYWIFSIFDNNYAPLNFKQKKFDFSWDIIKKEYLELAKKEQSNEEFFLLSHKLVARFKDLHTQSQFPRSPLPYHSKVAYLGFTGVRKGNYYKVTGLLPTISTNAKFPIKIDDEIMLLDNRPLFEIIATDFLPYRDVGQHQTNLTIHMKNIFHRSSLSHKMPTSRDAVLTVVRRDKRFKPNGKKKINVTLPWIIKDQSVFIEEQAEAENTTKAEGSIFSLLDDDLKKGRDSKIYRHLTGSYSDRRGSRQLLNSFRYQRNSSTWQSSFLEGLLSSEQELTPRERMEKNRKIPKSTIFIEGAKKYPAYIQALSNTEIVAGKKETKTKMIGYLYLDTFSTSEKEDLIIEEVTNTLNTFTEFNVEAIIVDLIDNLGGSLSLSLRIAQLFSPTKISTPKVQFKIGNNWMTQFQMLELSGQSDSDKAIGKRLNQAMKEDYKLGKSISRIHDVEDFFGFDINLSFDRNFGSPKIYLLINEMCASSCDIFAATLQDNKLATVAGSLSAGAGGSVKMHSFSPNSRMVLSQTESLIIRADGRYLENDGVVPDVPIDIQDSAFEKYDGAKNQLILEIVKTW